MEELGKYAVNLKILGSYPAAELPEGDSIQGPTRG
jgi:hypothetical protein